MAGLRSEGCKGLPFGLLGLSVIAAALAVTGDAVDARNHYQPSEDAHHSGGVHRHVHAEGYSPPSASIVVDGNTGKVLQESNPNAPRHPASLTKIMTLYLLSSGLTSTRSGSIRSLKSPQMQPGNRRRRWPQGWGDRRGRRCDQGGGYEIG
jgi:D-alanyl-D-alanine carboxypeptidase